MRRSVGKIAGTCVAAAALAVAAAAPVARAAERVVPFGFLGANAGGPMYERGFDFERELGAMARAGVESLRFSFFWARMQPHRRLADVPADERDRFDVAAGGVPTDFTTADDVVAAATRHGVRLLPVVVDAPSWAQRDPFDGASAPRSTGPWAAFLTALARRYGPAGDFWADHPELPEAPLRAWQLYNETDHTFWWTEQPATRDYVALLRAGGEAIRAVDPGALIVLAGHAGATWEVMARFYRAGARPHFDAVAIHPYTFEVANVLRSIYFTRLVMRRFGDARKPLLATEVGWPASKGRARLVYGFETTERDAAARLYALIPLLARHRRALGIARIFYESWITRYANRDNPFDFAGLRWLRVGGAISPKPSLLAYALRARQLEDCAKGAHARRCR